MNRIRRVLLSRVGHRDAWYDGVVLDFCDPDGSSTDTIISLPNGEGKTTLLSLLLCTFDSDQRHFVQHLQKPHQHFRDYFGPQPGFIVIEMECPSLGGDLLGGADIARRVFGQMVTVRDPGADPDRQFFAFDAGPDLNFDSLPLRGMVAPEAKEKAVDSRAEWRQWLAEASAKHPSLWTTQSQREWEQYLDTQGVDPWLVRRQVGFCSSEGGIDGFLDFRSELEFLTRFYAMVLDEERSASVRRTLSDSLAKLKSLPRLQDQVGVLRRLQAAFKPFAATALERRRAEDGLTQARAATAGLYQAIEQRARERREHVVALQQQARQTADDRQRIEDQLTQQQRRNEAARDQHHQRQLSEAEEALRVAEAAITEAGTESALLEAAAALSAWRVRQTEIDSDERALSQATGDLAPLLDVACAQGSRLRARLAAGADEHRADAERQSARNRRDRQQVEELSQQDKATRDEREQAVVEQSQGGERLARRDQARRDLLDAGILDQDEAVDSARQRWQHRLDELVDRIERVGNDSAEASRRQDQLRDEHTQRQVTRATLRGRLDQLGAEFETGRERHESLAGHPALRRLLGAERINPDAGDLASRIQERLQSLAAARHDLQRRLEALDHDRESIQSSRLSAPDDDSRRVEEALREQGLADARLYPRYLAELLPDVATATALTHSDPARFGGVLVYTGQALEQARTLVGQALGLRHPVVVSLAATTADESTPIPADRVIIPAHSAAAYNYPAAQALLQSLDQQHRALVDELEQKRGREEAYQAVLRQLRDYLRDFGQGRLKLLQADQQQARGELTQLERDIEQTGRDQRDIALRLAALERQRGELEPEHRLAQQAEEKLAHFEREHECGLEALRQALQQAAERIVACEQRLARNDTDRERLTQQQITGARLLAEHETAVEQLVKEQGDVERYQAQPEPPQESDSGPKISTEELRAAYHSACGAFDTLSRERGVDVLRAGLEEKQREARAREQAYHRQLADLDPARVQALGGQDLDRLEQANRGRRQQAEAEQKQWLETRGERRAEYRAFKPRHIGKGDKSPDLEALDTAALAGEIQTSAVQQEQLELRRQTLIGVQQAEQRRIDEHQQQDKLLQTRLTGIASQIDPASEPTPLQLPDRESDIDALQQTTLATQASSEATLTDASGAAARHYDAIRKLTNDDAFQRIEQRLAVELQNNSVDAACTAATQLAGHIEQRIDTVQFELDKLEENVGTVVGQLGNLTIEAIELLKKATSGTRVPDRVRHLGGQPILKMRAQFHQVAGEQRTELLRNYISRLVREDNLPENGGALAAELIVTLAGSFHAEGRLGLRLLKPSDVGIEYMDVAHKVGSGGESLTAALLLYLVMAQIRGRSRGDGIDPNSGFLILDNPLGKANKPALIRPQIELARQFGIQLIYASGIQDYNALSQFSHLLRLRRTHGDRISGRSHITASEVATIEGLSFDLKVDDQGA